jgi:uncharacterized protein with PQ loop repeat
VETPPRAVLVWLGAVSAACFTLSYLPQLLRTYRSRNVEGISTVYWVILILGYVTGFFYIWPLHDLILFVTYGLGFSCAVAMLIGCLLFRAR